MLFKRVIYSNGKIIFTDIDPIIPKIMCNIHTHAHTYFRSTGDVCVHTVYINTSTHIPARGTLRIESGLNNAMEKINTNTVKCQQFMEILSEKRSERSQGAASPRPVPSVPRGFPSDSPRTSPGNVRGHLIVTTSRLL